MKNKNKQTDKSLRFILLPLASFLYIYGVISLTTVVAIFIVYAFRRDWAILDGITPMMVLTIIIGVLIFFPAKRFRERMMQN
jgi:hypothetical protein